jgi:hypothetical protein
MVNLFIPASTFNNDFLQIYTKFHKNIVEWEIFFVGVILFSGLF